MRLLGDTREDVARSLRLLAVLAVLWPLMVAIDVALAVRGERP